MQADIFFLQVSLWTQWNVRHSRAITPPKGGNHADEPSLFILETGYRKILTDSVITPPPQYFDALPIELIDRSWVYVRTRLEIVAIKKVWIIRCILFNNQQYFVGTHESWIWSFCSYIFVFIVKIIHIV